MEWVSAAEFAHWVAFVVLVPITIEEEIAWMKLLRVRQKIQIEATLRRQLRALVMPRRDNAEVRLVPFQD